jgi:hypothetical protein
MNTAEKDIAQIKALMDRSARFLSLSGLSGVAAGIFALIGSALAYYWVYYPHSPFGYRSQYVNTPEVAAKLLFTAGAVLLLSLLVGTYFTFKKVKKTRAKIWNTASKRFVVHLLIPLTAGFFFIIALMLRDNYLIIAPACLLFYGLALINASHYTLGDIRYLGYSEVALGIIAALLPGYGLIFWALGFGVLHIVYGTIMHLKYDR